ncbi:MULTISPECIES: betaine/proline/choline family ABC transporter ATP-binding protein [Staphylococcus]|jgi:osmoprotectant transport system ATP-binding protein|uniref:Quaternary amine transport ATP-binding protein n=1 Tax=Staphylococcus nepalensis TaxID=214473 RepID=A0A2T4SA25_9STAP|nr:MULTISPECIES: betaine/proline/choline family ABC transporter ATP-binding protein [Staphylococcus]VDG66231.1 glycine betaine/L-proline transport ATP binding subunit [Lacrimispora indolis]MBO1205618.1 betaine/proline/choline family ABC transporter ATP-binding protein [Staphylococcus nepalensis]MBO1215910.1 betaine/proline/choline family ABC transporter ATP-binding protein [Staphylococcus nepalensis]MBO1221083.1 betaine/proline/choline family ABC transporter ATP-binding protein [Staphylococcus 
MLSIKNLSKVYGGTKKAVDNISLEIESGEFIAFIGTSGSGKTTALRMINRMIEATEGEIAINGKNVRKMNAVELRRKIGYVIQQIGLMPHMTIKENIVLVPKLLKWSEEKKEKKAKELIKLVDLPEEYLDRYPSQLSGGQQQRIGVVRALAAEQDVILMDEPFGALDPITRDTLQDLVKQLQQKLGKTFIFVTHDMDEAIKLADKICIMSEGQVVQYDTPDNILRHPANDFVRDFIGQNRLIQDRPNMRTVKDAMIRPVTVHADSSLNEAVKIMRERRVDTIFVVGNNSRLLGYLDIEDINQGLRGGKELIDMMQRDIYRVRVDSKLQDTVRTILKRNVRNVPVVDSDEETLIGLITRANLVDIVYDSIWGELDEDISAQKNAIVEPDNVGADK